MRHTHFIPFTALFAALLLQFFAVSPALAQAPALQSSVVSVDLPESYADLMRLEIVNGRFSDYSVGKMSIGAQNIDLRNGTLDSLVADLHNGEFDHLFVDTMAIHTDAFSFDTFQLLNKQRFELDRPITGTVALTLSEASLNRFIRHPRTIGKLESAIQKQTGGMKLVTFGNPSLDLYSRNRVRLSLTANFAGAATIPMEMEGKLVLADETLKIKDLEISSQKEKLPLPVDLVSVIETQLNNMINIRKLGGKTFAIHGKSLDMGKDAFTVNVVVNELGNPVILTTAMVRAVSHIFMKEADLYPSFQRSDGEHGIDLVGVMLGFGSLLANGAYVYRKG